MPALQVRNSRGVDQGEHLRRLFAAGARASTLGIGILDSQTRIESVNSSLAGETRAPIDYHIGRTSREVVGDLAGQVEPAYEQVLRTGKASSLMVEGHIRDTPEFGYWLTHCFPIITGSGAVEHVGVFVVNATAEKTTAQIFDALAIDPKIQLADAAGLLDKFDESIEHYHLELHRSFHDLAHPFTDPALKAELFRSSIKRLDRDVIEMRELIYAVISHFSVPTC
jgi:hypothetical protein